MVSGPGEECQSGINGEVEGLFWVGRQGGGRSALLLRCAALTFNKGRVKESLRGKPQSASGDTERYRAPLQRRQRSLVTSTSTAHHFLCLVVPRTEAVLLGWWSPRCSLRLASWCLWVLALEKEVTVEHRSRMSRSVRAFRAGPPLQTLRVCRRHTHKGKGAHKGKRCNLREGRQGGQVHTGEHERKNSKRCGSNVSERTEGRGNGGEGTSLQTLPPPHTHAQCHCRENCMGRGTGKGRGERVHNSHGPYEEHLRNKACSSGCVSALATPLCKSQGEKNVFHVEQVAPQQVRKRQNFARIDREKGASHDAERPLHGATGLALKKEEKEAEVR